MDYTFDASFGSDSAYVAGVDEAGCGPWAGPLVAAAVILTPSLLPESIFYSLDDSKKLTKIKRTLLYEGLMAHEGKGVCLSVATIRVADIDQLLIGDANRLAMCQAVDGLSCAPDILLCDGIRDPRHPIRTHMIKRGDGLSPSIAAASIIAKVTRDKIMAELDEIFPHYGWARNAGYGTAHHRQAIETHGLTPHHRRSFKPIFQFLAVFENSL